MHAIEIAKTPGSLCEKDVPDLYLQVALHRGFSQQMDTANPAFAKAIDTEPDKSGFHATLVYLYWGCLARENGQYPLAAEKLNIALKMAKTLPPEKRGTLLADTMFMAGTVKEHLGSATEGKSLRLASVSEIEIQKKLHSKLGPDFFHRL